MHPLRPGDPAPDFTLPSPYGVEVSLRPLLKDGALVVEFVRGTWDPDGRRRLGEMSDAKMRLLERTARCTVISCERPDSARKFIESGSGPLTLLLDPLRQTSRDYGAFRRFSFGALNVAMPSTFVIDRCGFVRFAHVGRSPIDAAPLTQIYDELARLQDESRGRS